MWWKFAVFFISVVVCVVDARLECINAEMSHDEPTAIFTNEDVELVNCTLNNTSIWLHGSSAILQSVMFLNAPCPAIGAAVSGSITLSENNISCEPTSPKNIIVRHDDYIMHDDRNAAMWLRRFMDASDVRTMMCEMVGVRKKPLFNLYSPVKAGGVLHNRNKQ